MKTTLLIVIWFGLLIAISYGGWKVSRWWNYKFGYQLMVSTEIDKRIVPLEKRIANLEYEINVLKTNK